MKFALIAAALVSLVASVFFVDSSTPEKLRARYAEAGQGGAPLKVLIVPGHDNDAWGTEYKGLKEADLTLALGTKIAAALTKDPHLAVTIARTDAGYNPTLSAYFTDHRADIIAFQKSQRAQMNQLLSNGTVASNVIVSHNTAPSEVALRLWGINKWANENAYDLVIHVHFNDVPRKDRSKPGAYTGFAIYIPEHQFSNAKGSRAVAGAIETELEKSFSPSTHPKEKDTPVEDQELIAIGSNNSLDGAGMLVEYAYIYEPSVLNTSTRADTLTTMTQATYDGVEHFFNP